MLLAPHIERRFQMVLAAGKFARHGRSPPDSESTLRLKQSTRSQRSAARRRVSLNCRIQPGVVPTTIEELEYVK